MTENKKLKTLSIVLLVLGAILNLVPELFCSVIGVCLMIGGLLIQLRNKVAKESVVLSLVLNSISIVICGFCLLVDLVYKSGDFKLGIFPLALTSIISIVLSAITIVISVVVLKKKVEVQE